MISQCEDDVLSKNAVIFPALVIQPLPAILIWPDSRVKKGQISENGFGRRAFPFCTMAN